MKFSATVALVMIGLFVTQSAPAQSPARRTARRPVAAQPKNAQPEANTPPQPTPAVTQSSPLPDTTIPTNLAILDGQTITVSDLDRGVAQEIGKLGESIAQARREILDVMINTALLDIESKKRKMAVQEIYDLEVSKRLAEPTDAEITQFIDANRAELAQSDPAAIRKDAAAFLKAQREQKLSEALVGRLKQVTPATITGDLNSPDLKPTTVLATVGGQPILASTLDERMKPVVYKLRLSAYQVTRDALDRTINDLLMLAEARRRNVPPESLIRSEITDKVHGPTDAEVEKFYADNKARINGELASVRYQIADYLREKEGQDLERALSERLRKGANIRILLVEPEAPVQVINTAGEPARGDVNAPVTVVEFTDFQCPACAAMQPVLDEVLPTYGNKVRFVVRNYPLRRHENARKAAEAANAANAQGKFFEYTALLFKRQNALDVPSLKKYASEVGLDRTRFDAELDKGVHAADVRHDLDDGEKAGIDSTPTVFINGVKLYDLSPEGLRAAIDKALKKAGR
jgi:protein-disulfide isomerase